MMSLVHDDYTSRIEASLYERMDRLRNGGETDRNMLKASEEKTSLTERELKEFLLHRSPQMLALVLEMN